MALVGEWKSITVRRVFSGLLSVVLNKATGLKGKMLGTRDPYAILRMRSVSGVDTWKSSAKSNTRNPTWDEQTTFLVQDLERDVLEIRIFQNDVAQRLFVTDDEIGTSILPLRMLIDKQPWGTQYNVSLGTGQGSAVLTFRLHIFDYPDNPSPPLVTPLEMLEKRFGNEILLPDNIVPPCNIIGFLQVRVIRGQGLPWCGPGQSSPAQYKVVLDIGRQKFATRPYRWLGCPVWEEYTEFIISSAEKDTLSVDVVRQPTAVTGPDSDIPVGFVQLQLSTPNLDSGPTWFNLLQKGSVSNAQRLSHDSSAVTPQIMLDVRLARLAHG
uniref:C2 domain-containing protein n=1 Tax=Cryptomonas curvata TaxID=233186 RepID=A0A7S0QRJ9_9CRYP|mmetsp:Transcript_52004/g.108608  ORF Transcript_52004/g.108608 Transcript_52004/m.108608 type:complete len:325 (+) Transcript_52004:892-1866(+)